MKRTFFAKAKNKVGDVYLYDEIGESYFGGVGPNTVKDALTEIGAVDTLNIYINSPGGNVFDGMAIYNQFARFNARKIVHVDGIAASIASVIAMVGDEINIASNAMFMIHDPSGICFGTAEDMRATAGALDKVRETIVNTYVARTKQKADDLANWMKAETWMKADEAKSRGFADKVTGDEQQMQDMAFPLLAKFKNTPKALLERAPDARSMLAKMQMRIAKNSGASLAK